VSRVQSIALILLLCVTPLQAQVASASITIDAQKIENSISPLLYGHFLEFMYQGVKRGVHAELIRNRSFEEPANAIGLSRYWERYPDDRNDDYALSFSWDETNPYPLRRQVEIETDERPPREHSLRVDSGEGVIARHGFYQPGVSVRAGLEYRGYLWLKTEKYSGTIIVALEADSDDGAVYATEEISHIVSDWRKYEFVLQPTKSDLLARFCILFTGKGRVWLDQISLLPGDVAAGGVRRDVFERVKALKPAFLRWPGGNVAQDYRWRWGVGPRDQRFTWTNLSWKNEPEPSDFGTDEYVQFARAVGAEPTITVNIEGRGATVEEAAAWVEYCNGPPTSKYGALRAAHGHPEPYRIKFWEMGNEIWGSWVRGHSNAEVYARNYNRYVRAMRAVDPSLTFIAVGDNDMSWNRTVISRVGQDIDYLAIHHYYGRREIADDAMNLFARPLFYERFYQQVRALLRELAPQRSIKLAINEWGLDLPSERQYSMESALYGARLMNVFERQGALVEMSAVSDLVNGWPGGIIQAGRHSVFVSPIYFVNQLYNENRGSERLAVTVESPTFDSSREGKNVPYLDVTVSRSLDGKRIFIKAVNTDPVRALATKIQLSGVAIMTGAQMSVVNGPSLQSWNNFRQPDAVSISRASLRAGNNFSVVFPRHSVSVITLSGRQNRER
jgi:alpha-N-arabinofuranosidase